MLGRVSLIRDIETRQLLDISATFERYRDSDFGRKLYLIQNSLFGVDIQPVASQIAKLRFFISLAIEQEPTADAATNYGIKPLPNLETRFVAANTLLGLDKPAQQTLGRTATVARLERALHENRERHFHATTRRTKTTYRKRDAKLRTELAAALRTAGFPATDAGKIAQWDPYDQHACADWFDAEYMFGITAGFAVVLGNPPYISHDKIERDLKDKIRRMYQTYQSFADKCCYFIEKAVGLQSQSGVLSIINSNSYLRAEYGKPIRKFLKKHNYLGDYIQEGSVPLRHLSAWFDPCRKVETNPDVITFPEAKGRTAPGRPLSGCVSPSLLGQVVRGLQSHPEVGATPTDPFQRHCRRNADASVQQPRQILTRRVQPFRTLRHGPIFGFHAFADALAGVRGVLHCHRCLPQW